MNAVQICEFDGRCQVLTTTQSWGDFMRSAQNLEVNATLTQRASKGLTLMAGAVLLIAATSTVQAASPASSAVAPAATSGGSQLEEVIVTARRTEESAQVVPVSITALSADALERKVVLNVQDLQTSVPGLFISPNSQGGAPTFAIRGAKADNGTSATVAVYIDDVPVVSTLSVANMVYDLQSVSTLKGPQGTLFGANSTGGAIIFLPNKPTNKFEGYGSVGFGSYSRQQYQGMVNLPISDVLQLRLAAEVVRRNGYERNSPSSTGSAFNGIKGYDDDKHESARVSVRFKPNERLVNDLVFDYFHVNDQPNQAVPTVFRGRYSYTTFIGGFVPGFPDIPVDYAKAGIVVPSDRNNLSLSPDPTWNKAKTWGVDNTTSYEINDNLSFKNVIGYRHDDTDTSEQNGGGANVAVDGRTAYGNKQWSVEPSLDWSSDDKRWHNKTGIFVSNLKIHTGNSYRVIGLPFDFSGFGPGAAAIGGAVGAFYPLQSNSIYDRETKSHAVYSQTSLKVSDELTATLGLRYSWDKGTYQAQNRLAFTAVEGSLGPYGDFSFGHCNAGALSAYDNYDPVGCTGQKSTKSSAPSWTFSLDDQINAKQMVYATTRGGYLRGGFNNQIDPATTGMPQTFAPEKVVDFEVGLKSDWSLWSRPIRTNLAGFYGNYTGQQRVQNGTTKDGVTFTGVVNAGSTTFYGFDTDVLYAVTDNLELSASWNYIISKYTKFDAVLAIPGVAAFKDLIGQQASQTPRNVLTAGATYKWPLASTVGTLSSSVSYFWRSQTVARDSPTIAGPVGADGQLSSITTDYTAYDQLAAFSIIDFSTDWKGIMGSHFDAGIWVKNVGDKTYAVYNSNQLLQFGYSTSTLAPPRTYGANLRYNF
jgi:outer membrane receptor protein involved in Fe transport